MEKQQLLSAVRHTVLPNGLTIICLKKKGAPIVSAQVWYKTGSVNERDGIRGISHFFEHMMFRGSKNVGSQEHARKINDAGGHCNAFTAEDITAYLNSVPRDSLDMVLKLEADRMQHLLINQDILNTERNVIIEEYQGYMNNPLSKAFLEFRSIFYGEHPYAISALGRLDDIRAITVDDCLAYYRTWYSPGNAVVVIAGDFDSEDDIFERVNATLGAVPGSATAQQHVVMSPNGFVRPRKDAWMQRKVDFDVPFLVMGYPAPPSSSDDALALEVLQLILSQGETSRMHREIVRKQSLAVMAGGMNQCLKLAGMSMFFAVFTPNVPVHTVEKAILRQIELIKTSGVTAEELEKTKNTSLTGRIFDLYSAEQICHRLGYAQTVEGDYQSWIRRLDALERIDVDMLVAAAQHYWDDSKRLSLYLQPKKIKIMTFVAGLFLRFLNKR